MYRIEEKLLENINRRALRKPDLSMIDEPKKIVIHWTANLNPSATAMANRNYFNRDDSKATATIYYKWAWGSAHYIIDKKRIIRCIPENEVAYHVGDSVRSKEQVKKNLSNLDVDDILIAPNAINRANYHYIGIELCVNDLSPDAWREVMKRTAFLLADIIRRTGLGWDDVIRHFDVTGKPCPAMFMPVTYKNGTGKQTTDIHWTMFIDLLKSYAKDAEPLDDVSTAPQFGDDRILQPELMEPVENLPWWKRIFI